MEARIINRCIKRQKRKLRIVPGICKSNKRRFLRSFSWCCDTWATPDPNLKLGEILENWRYSIKISQYTWAISYELSHWGYKWVINESSWLRQWQIRMTSNMSEHSLNKYLQYYAYLLVFFAMTVVCWAQNIQKWLKSDFENKPKFNSFDQELVRSRMNEISSYQRIEKWLMSQFQKNNKDTFSL